MRNLSCISMICTVLLLPVEVLGQTPPVPGNGPDSCGRGIGGMLWKQGTSNNEWEYVPKLSCLTEIFADAGTKRHGIDDSEILGQAEAVFGNAVDVLARLRAQSESLEVHIIDVRNARNALEQEGTARAAISRHNQGIQTKVAEGDSLLDDADTALIALLEQEPQLNRLASGKREELLELSTELIVAIDETRRRLGKVMGELKGVVIVR